MDRVLLEGMSFQGRHGVRAAEREKPQEFRVDVEVDCDLQLVKATSDDFFARDNAIARFPEGVVDLVFIDGLHLFEFALRDFINAEKLAHPGSVVVFDDMLPRTSDEAARDRHTTMWAGDVYNVALALERYRPDLVLVPVDTVPTGLLLVVGLDPTNTVLQDKYDDVVAAFRHDDPQRVPPEILNRTQAADPEKLLAADVFQKVSDLRGQEQVPDFAELLPLRGSASYQPVPYDNPARPLIPAEAIDVPRHGIVNAHPSLLPHYRGPFPIAWAVRNGETEIGMSYHLMDGQFDTGNLLAQTPMPLSDDATWETLQAQFAEVTPPLLAKVFDRLTSGDRGDVQEGGEYQSVFEDDYRFVDLTQKAADVHRQVHAWSFVPPILPNLGPLLERDGTRVRLLRTSLTEVAGAERIDCADGPLWILETA